MANPSGRGTDWGTRVQQSIKSFANEMLASEIDRYAVAGKKAMVLIHRDIIGEWFGEYNAESMQHAINEHTVTYVTRLYADKDGNPYGRITLQGYVDSLYYNQFQEIHNWNKRNDIGQSHDDLVEFVMYLQLYQGIIGLPERGVRKLPKYTWIFGRGHIDGDGRWVNDNFIQKTPLLSYIKESAQWGTWKTTVNSFLV